MPQRNLYEPIASSEEMDTEHGGAGVRWKGAYSVIIIAIAILTLVALIIVACALALELGNLSNKTEQNKQNAELSKEYESGSQFEWYSDELHKNMDLTVHPCEDFHRFVCGNWLWDSMYESYVAMQRMFILEHTRIALERALIRETSSNSTALQSIIDLYRECVNHHSAHDHFGLQSVRQLLKEVIRNGTMFDEFELRANDSAQTMVDNQKNDEVLTQIVKLFKHTGPDDDADVAQWMDSYVEAWLVSVFSLIDIRIDEFASSNRSIRISLIPLLNYTNLYDDFVKLQKTVTYYFHVQNQTLLDEAIYEVLHFKTNLTGIFKNVTLTTNTKKYIPMSLAHLKNKSSGEFDWTLLLNKFATRTNSTNRFTDRDTVEVNAKQLKLFLPFTQLIAQTPIRVLRNLVALSTMDFFKSLVKFNSSYKINSHQKPYACITKYTKHLTPIYTRLLVDHFGREEMQDSQYHITEMVRQVKASFSETLKQIEWLDDVTRQRALDKLDSMKSSIAFPKWILNNEALDQKFGFDEMDQDSPLIIKGHHVESYLNLIRLSAGGTWRNLNLPPNKSNEFIFDNRAGYDFETNNFVISINNISPFTFSLEYPAAINYGKIGALIGREIAHGFVGIGKQFDKQGKFVDWLTDKISGHFNNLSKCFVEQYEELVEPSTGVKMNANATLHSNIADNIGVKQAYLAFHLFFKQFASYEAVSLSFGHFSVQQLFFIAYGQNFCATKLDNETQQESVHIHSPFALGANIALAHFDQFARAFNCPVGSKMNPKHKCSFW